MTTALTRMRTARTGSVGVCALILFVVILILP